MDPDSLPKKEPRKVRFAPKVPPKREQKIGLPKVVKVEDDIDAVKQELLQRRFNEAKLGVRPKFERKAEPVQVAFGHGASSSTIRSYGFHKGLKKDQDGAGGVEEYKEPWDYHSYHPITLPLRGSHSGNPELRNREEFGEDAQISAYDESVTNAADDLGLSYPENSIFFIQLPKNMPAIKTLADKQVDEVGKNAGKQVGEAGNPIEGKKAPKPNPSNLESLPPGLMGKMLIYKSGAVKLKLGETLYDVSSGLDRVFAQDVVAMNTEQKICCNLGEINKCMVVTPDVDSMLDSIL